jgi:protein required for attachment to host cells
MQKWFQPKLDSHVPEKEKIPRTWVVIADGKSAHIYCKTVNRLAVILDEGNDFLPHQHNGAHQNRGHRSWVSSETIHYCSNPEDRLDHLHLSSFVHKLAELLDKAEKEKVFDRLIVIAPPAVLGQMRQHFSSDVQQCIIAELNKNLTHLSERELYDYLENILWF